MDRLTYTLSAKDSQYRDANNIRKIVHNKYMQDIYNRLAEYEDTGLTPEEIRKILTDAPPVAEITLDKGVSLERLRELIRKDANGRLSSPTEEPVRRGKWLPDNETHELEIRICSECGSHSYGSMWGLKVYNYCPFCGVKMEMELGDPWN